MKGQWKLTLTSEKKLTPKKYLMQVMNIDKEINVLIRERDKMRKTFLSASRLEHDKTFSLTVSKPSEEIVLKLEEYDESIDEKIDTLVDLKKQISEEIDQVEMRNHRVLLRYRYINCMDFNDIAEDMQFGQRYIYDVHRNALKEFKKTHPDKNWLNK